MSGSFDYQYLIDVFLLPAYMYFKKKIIIIKSKLNEINLYPKVCHDVATFFSSVIG